MRLKGRDPDEVVGALRNDAQPPACNSLSDLDRDAALASEATDMCSDAPSLQEVLDAIARLRNGRQQVPMGFPQSY